MPQLWRGSLRARGGSSSGEPWVRVRFAFRAARRCRFRLWGPLPERLAGRAGTRAQRAGTARTFVWVTAEAPEQVCAYFSLAPTELTRDALPRGQSSGYSTVPGYLLARLAVSTDLHGLGYGGQVLVDALSRAANAAETGGGRLIVVDAIDDAAANFYRHYDFTPVKDNPHRLVLKMATVRKLLG